MSIYYSTEIIKTGGKVQYPCRRVVTDEIDELMLVFRKLRTIDKASVSLQVPPRGLPATKSKKLPFIQVRESLIDEVRSLGGVKIPDAYLWVLIYQLKELFYRLDEESQCEKGDQYFVRKIRSKVVELLVGKRCITGNFAPGEWVDDPSDLEDPEVGRVIKTLNRRIEKIDLGRRSDLNFSSKQEVDAEMKYERNKKVPSGPVEEDTMILKWISADEDGRLRLQEDSFLTFKLRAKGYLPA